jgi:hypothetical protein
VFCQESGGVVSICFICGSTKKRLIVLRGIRENHGV